MEREKQREKERQSRQQQVQSENNVKDKKELFGSPVKVKFYSFRNSQRVTGTSLLIFVSIVVFSRPFSLQLSGVVFFKIRPGYVSPPPLPTTFTGK